jgi:hypothetical protein
MGACRRRAFSGNRSAAGDQINGHAIRKASKQI